MKFNNAFQAYSLWCCFLLSLVLTVGCSNEGGGRSSQLVTKNEIVKPATVKIALDSLASVHYGGYYSAQADNFFAQQQLTASIISEKSPADAIAGVVGGEYDFGIADADQILLARARSDDIVALLAPLNSSTTCIMIHQGLKNGLEGVQSIQELKGGIESSDLKKEVDSSHAKLKPFRLAMDQSSPLWKILPYVLSEKHFQLAAVKMVASEPNNLDVFYQDKLYGYQADVLADPYLAKREGVETQCLMLPESLMYNPYGSVLFARRDYIKKNPSVVQRVVKAAQLGWAKYHHAPQSANQLIHQNNSKFDQVELDDAAKELRAYLVPKIFLNSKRDPRLDHLPKPSVGSMSSFRWQQIAKILEESGVAEGVEKAAEKSFETKFLAP